MFEWLSRSMRSVSRSASDVEKMDFGSVQSWGELDTR
jgi:uncharacterized protein YegL